MSESRLHEWVLFLGAVFVAVLATIDRDPFGMALACFLLIGSHGIEARRLRREDQAIHQLRDKRRRL